jgi:hypothetical protein
LVTKKKVKIPPENEISPEIQLAEIMSAKPLTLSAVVSRSFMILVIDQFIIIIIMPSINLQYGHLQLCTTFINILHSSSKQITTRNHHINNFNHHHQSHHIIIIDDKNNNGFLAGKIRCR